MNVSCGALLDGGRGGDCSTVMLTSLEILDSSVDSERVLELVVFLRPRHNICAADLEKSEQHEKDKHALALLPRP